MTDSAPAVQVALDQLADALDAMDPLTRLQFAQATLSAGEQPQTRPIWSSLYLLTESTEPDRLGHLVSVLEVVGPDVREALITVATRAQQNDQPRGAVWQALAGLLAAIELPPDDQAP